MVKHSTISDRKRGEWNGDVFYRNRVHLYCNMGHHFRSLANGGHIDSSLLLVSLVHSNQFLFADFMDGLKVHGLLIKHNVLVCTTFKVIVEIK